MARIQICWTSRGEPRPQVFDLEPEGEGTPNDFFSEEDEDWDSGDHGGWPVLPSNAG